jgi:excinuclease ABC subunit A
MHRTKLRGARTHNLQGLDLDLEPGTLVVIAGPSGAGKSSLAFGTLYAEGQRRYVESFSAYARQFLERLARPPVDELDPVPAGIAVDRAGTVKTSRSTVGTMTEVADYAKGLWARLGELHCPTRGHRIGDDDPERAADRVLAELPGARIMVTFPVEARDPEHFIGVREGLVADGYRRLRVDGEVRDLDEVRPSDVFGPDALDGGRPGKKPTSGRKRQRTQKASLRKREAKDPAEAEDPRASSAAFRRRLCQVPETTRVEVVADRLVARPEDRGRLVEALEAALRKGGGEAAVVTRDGERLPFSRGLRCASCRLRFREPRPGMFSFNNPVGACPTCRGFGRVIGVDFDKVIPDRTKTLAGGAIAAWTGKSSSWERKYLKKEAAKAEVPMDVPVGELTPDQWRWLLEGDGRGWPEGWPGIRGWFDWLESKAYRMHVRVFLSRYRSYEPCGDCGGDRLQPESLLWTIDGVRIADFFQMPVSEALGFVDGLTARNGQDAATALLLEETRGRLQTLVDVGLGYLTLDRQSRTLSGGEAQRVSLTGALGASLTGAMFVLDEPTVGLHPSDVDRLYGVVRQLTDGGNLALVVEHDPDLIAGADRVIELGPGAGEHGGRIVFDGTPAALRKAGTATAGALADARKHTRPRRYPSVWLTLEGATGHNLRDADLRIPLGALTCVTGPSGSGKSSLVLETLVPSVQRALGEAGDPPLPFRRIDRAKAFSGVVHVDQSSMGRTSRGNPATYLGAWDVIRKRFHAEKLSVERGYTLGTFSFNVPGGRCEVCKGQGYETVEMQFLADVTFSCPTCAGRRFVGPILDVKHKGMDIADVLDLTANEALEAFGDDGQLRRRLGPMVDVGLGYLTLGQPLNTLSGGEAQRLKLAAALADTRRGSLVVLDEPTAGLHAVDVAPLLATFDRLVERGDTVVVVEHDMGVAAHADWVIDLGPGAGAEGGRIVAEGTPEEVAASTASPTAPHLARALGLGRPARGGARGGRRRDATRKKAAAAKALRAPRRAGGGAQDPGRDGVITVAHAREHNLKDVSVDLPRDQLVVVTGPSGSGKSTLAFDIVFAEGQRRYLETLSPYARQYMPQMPRPDVDRVAGVPPTVSLEQRMTRGGGNSTVATVTEVAHFLRLLYARIGQRKDAGGETTSAAESPPAFAARVRRHFGRRSKVQILAPVVQGRKGFHGEVLAKARKDGFDRARIDGKVRAITEGLRLERYKEHDVDLLVNSLRAGDEELETAIRVASERSKGPVRVLGARGAELFGEVSERGEAASSSVLDPRLFSFNTRQGQCPTCEGKGALVRTVGRGKNARDEAWTCPDCDGTRLSAFARSIVVQGRPITDYLGLTVTEARAALSGMSLAGREAIIGEPVLGELDRRLAFLEEVGVGYLNLDRAASTLSGGETQRVRLAAQLGAGLTGILYVLDEPTIGLHPRDTGRLVAALRALVDKGNTVLVVEHDADTILAADHVLDIGPGGGHRGGRVLAQGAPGDLVDDPASVTLPSLARAASVPEKRRKAADWLELTGAAANNLRGASARFPLGGLTVVTGVSGSGKSSLVREVLLPAVRSTLGLQTDPPGPHDALTGVDALKRAVEVDQSPIGRTPRSVPATYVGVWDEVRKLLSGVPEARARGYGPGRFSFNVAEGRCPVCGGNGVLTAEMAFLPDVLLPCDACGGMRFTPETLEVKLHGLSAGEILDLEIEEAREVFHQVPRVAQPLGLLADLGLGYLRLGQPSNTLSGGEAQRLKLVAELGTSASGPTLYVLDEPTTGLHRDDVGRLLALLARFVDRGDTVVVIEHHPDVMVIADHLVDLGPEGGAGGGRVVTQGTPEHVARSKRSHTAQVLREFLPDL